MTILDSLKENWNERPSSEKNILIVVGVFFICSLFYLLVYDPLVTLRDQQKSKLSAQERQYSQVVRLVDRYQQQQSTPKALSEGLAGLIDKSLQDNGLAMQGFQPGQNNDARLRLTNIRYESLIQWLYDIEYEYKMTIEELSLTQVEKTGLLTANVRLTQSY